jgi:hypothetical protein
MDRLYIRRVGPWRNNGTGCRNGAQAAPRLPVYGARAARLRRRGSQSSAPRCHTSLRQRYQRQVAALPPNMRGAAKPLAGRGAARNLEDGNLGWPALGVEEARSSCPHQLRHLHRSRATQGDTPWKRWVGFYGAKARLRRHLSTVRRRNPKRPFSQPNLGKVMLHPRGTSSTSRRQPHVLSGRRDHNLVQLRSKVLPAPFHAENPGPLRCNGAVAPIRTCIVPTWESKSNAPSGQ